MSPVVGYGEIFAARGSAYDDAMGRWPDARADEFAFAVSAAGIAGGDRVVDVPAGGGYLRDHLPVATTYLAVEPSAAFVAGCRRRGVEVVESSLRAEAVGAATADVVVSVAGVHHEDDHVGLLRSWRRIARPGGTVALIDVAEGTAPAAFLDGFVGAHNGEGHRGRYLADGGEALAEEAGLTDARTIDGAYCWWAPDERSLAEFCAGLFGLRGVTPEQVIAAIDADLGIEQDHGRVGMRWGLRAVVARSAG